MLILPHDILLHERFRVLRRRRRLRDLGDEVGGRSLGDAVDQDADERDLEECEEGDREAVEDAFAVVEPGPLLRAAVMQAGEVGFELDLKIFQ